LPISINKEAKVLKVPTGQLKSNYLSIKDLQSKNTQAKEDAEQEDATGKEQKPFTYDDLKMAWRKFAYTAKENGLDTLYSAMIQRDPVRKEGNIYEQFVENTIQQNFFQQNLGDVLGFLRAELQNWSIGLEISIESETNASKTLYSGKDKFQDMAKRNPHLNTLKQKFKLNIEF
jgi:DNA polymerase-3 subunit gamma/tau